MAADSASEGKPSRGNSGFMVDETVLVTEQAPVEAPQTEKMLSVDHVNEIVKREKASAADKVRREMEAMHAQEMQKMRSESPKTFGGIEQSREDEIEQRIIERLIAKAKEADDEADRVSYENEQKSRADKYFDKMSFGKDKYQDFNEVMGGFKPAAFHEIVFLAADLDNTADVMYDLRKNPTKLATLNHLATRDPELARLELIKLSQSIAHNEQAKADHVPTNAPLSHLKSSTAGIDSGKMGLQDYKKADWLRG